MANLDDIKTIMSFIDTYWKKNHLVGCNRDFFNYEFVHGNRVGFYLAIDKETKNINACLGVYFYNDVYVKGESDLSGGMFLASPECRVPFIGMELFKHFLKDMNPRAYISPGVNPRTAKPLIERILKQEVGTMKHYYILNREIDYSIANIIDVKSNPYLEGEKNIKVFKNADEMYKDFDDDYYKKNCIPYKDRWFIEKRYFNHIKYNYDMISITENLVAVGRIIEVNGSKCFRIVDLLGNRQEYVKLARSIYAFIVENECEYADLYEVGLDDEQLIAAGFILRDVEDKNIIPNYFEPYEKQNVEIYYHRINQNAVILKGDGDQDRPNFL